MRALRRPRPNLEIGLREVDDLTLRRAERLHIEIDPIKMALDRWSKSIPVGSRFVVVDCTGAGLVQIGVTDDCETSISISMATSRWVSTSRSGMTSFSMNSWMVVPCGRCQVRRYGREVRVLRCNTGEGTLRADSGGKCRGRTQCGYARR